MKGYKGGMIMHDLIEIVGKGSIIQHGEHNDRIYLMKLKKQDTGMILKDLSNLAHKYNYSKIFCKVPSYIAPLFFNDGYILEAFIPKCNNNQEDVFFVSKFLDSHRFINIERNQLRILNQLLSGKLQIKKTFKNNTTDYRVRKLDKSDIKQITNIYREVFISYPFPIHNPAYILKTMAANIQYFGVEKNKNLIALASSEIDFEGNNAEMTDFATHPAHNGNNLSNLLLEVMEKEMKKQEITALYTIARLNSIPINKTFLRHGYKYSGTLINNTNISGNIESMNVYYKHL